MKCNECGKEMVKIERRTEMSEMEEDVTDGQMADYFAAESSGDFGSWGMGVVEYHCRKCKTTLEAISDELRDLDVLIERWHDKTRVGDYFEKFIFEYLAFNAYLKSQVAISAMFDREAIEVLKEQSGLRDPYLNMIKSGQEPWLQDAWLAIIEELQRQPLRNSSRDYDYPELEGRWTMPNGGGIEGGNDKKGVVHSVADWANMVEFWYAVRNNLFHAGKDPTLKRDIFMVEHAFITLNAFMRMVM